MSAIQMISFGIISAISIQALAQAPSPTQLSPKESRLAWNQSNYTKTEAMVPMRDGKKLYTVIYSPKDRSKPLPFILARTPYGSSGQLYGSDKLPENLGFFGREPLTKEGFIFVQQDVRGRYHSSDAGSFVEMRPIRSDRDSKAVDEVTDCWDTVQWVLEHVPENNGSVGLMGLSYLGFYAACGLVNPHPAVKVAIVQAPMMDAVQGDDFRHNGALHLVHAFTWLNNYMRSDTKTTGKSEGVDPGSSDAYHWVLQLGTLTNAANIAKMDGTTSWRDLRTHPHYDSFWEAKGLAKHLRETKVPTIVLGGWFDSEDLFGTFRAFKALNGTGNSPVHLVMGPWTHGGWMLDEFNSGVVDGDRRLGSINFGENLAARFQKETLFPFLLEHLKTGTPVALPKAMMFETGANQWRSIGEWPPKGAQTRSFYVQSRGTLRVETPQDSNGQDDFVSDPSHPVPHYPDPLFEYGEDYPVANQWFASTRPDVLVYKTSPLVENETLAGAIQVDLWVSTTGTDADWVVKVIDVWPDGTNPMYERKPGRMEAFQQLVRGDILRGKYRNSLEKPEAFEPGKPTRVTFKMPDAFHTFKKGHRIMVQIQSSWFPLFDRNPQVFMDNIMEAKVEDFRKATHTVFRTQKLPSRVVLPMHRFGDKEVSP